MPHCDYSSRERLSVPLPSGCQQSRSTSCIQLQLSQPASLLFYLSRKLVPDLDLQVGRKNMARTRSREAPRTSTASAILTALALLGRRVAAEAGVTTNTDAWHVTIASLADVVHAAAPSDPWGTGLRTDRPAFVSLQARGDTGAGGCSKSVAASGLGPYSGIPDLVTLALADVDGAAVGDILKETGFNINADDARGAACGALGFLPRRSLASAPQLVVWDPRGDENVGDWIADKMAAAVEICNEREVEGDTGDDEEEEEGGKGADAEHALSMDIWFKAGPGSELQRTGFRKMKPGTCQWMATFVGTTLVAKDFKTGEVVGEHLVGHSGLFVVHPFDELNPGTCSDIGPRVKPATDAETMSSRRAAEAARKAAIVREPKTLPHFTEVGFKKTRVPPNVWDTIMTYYNDNKQSPKLEMWGKNNVYTNNEEAPSYMVNVPEDWVKGGIKNQIWEGLRPTLEEWAGDISLTPTALYGIRLYTNGSWLANHIDTKNTHVISTIINVDQDVEEDWELEIFDHAGAAHHVTMVPGDMVLYESATCVHGRPVPLKGKYFANVFTHFKPVDDALWPV
ncbi:unnamed protein product [Phaeothamnion confervicola]